MQTMRRPKPANDLRYVLMMPSFYGGTAWIITLALYWLGPLDWNAESEVSVFVFVGVAVSFLCSFLLFQSSYQQVARSSSGGIPQSVPQVTSAGRGISMPTWLLLLHLAGLLGVAIYVREMSQYFGSLGNFYSILQDSSHLIRWANAEVTSPGTQIAYLGWVAAALTSYRCFRGELPKKWLVLVLLQIVANAQWIDRTRPTTIVFLCYLMYMLSRRQWSFSRAILFNGLLLTGAVGLFVMIGLWVGKVTATTDGASDGDLTPAWTNTCFYLTSSYAFCNDVLIHDIPVDGPPYTLTPFCKILAACGLMDRAPNLILDFRAVPYSTNVGTFLISFYWDGGWGYMLVGILFYTFGLDYLGWRLLRAQNDFAFVGWAMTCWIACMAFFATKIANTETWVFYAVALYGVLTSRSVQHYLPRRMSQLEGDISAKINE